MKIIILVAAVLFAACSTKENVRALVVTGGHDFEHKPFYEMFAAMDGVKVDSVRQPEANRVWGSPSVDQYDVFVFYDMVQDITEEQKQAFLDMAQRGAGMVFLHHSLASYQEWDEFLRLLGGRYHLDPQDKSKASTYKHDVDVDVHIADPNHPITRGLQDFTIRDEVYGNFEVLPGVHPLLTTNHPESSETIAWTNDYGNSRIVYIQLGHDRNAYENPNYRALVRNAVFWAAGR